MPSFLNDVKKRSSVEDEGVGAPCMRKRFCLHPLPLQTCCIAYCITRSVPSLLTEQSQTIAMPIPGSFVCACQHLLSPRAE
ncbi:hypothetical protein CEXT_79071 [Caerostris extrusa]|uniref:Uncharacterized protein n=1 Tax=Caerostris extrusa TaxID=172846 RepID=A0AAV4PR90_CAEEX|nr:hypothetical protein CEXT_79071 [Caerostris extrusa]